MSNENEKLGVDLEVGNEGPAGKAIDDFYSKLIATQKGIDGLGKNATFAKEFTSKLADVEKKAVQTQRAFQGFANFSSKGIDGITKASVTLQGEAVKVQKRLAEIRATDTAGKSDSFITALAGEARTAEAALARLERQADRLKAKRASEGAAGSGRAGEIGEGLAGGLGIPTSAGAVAAIGAGAVVVGIKQGADAAREAANANRLLAATAKESGISYSFLTAQAKEFGDQTLQSNREATKSFASIVTFANAAGRSDKLVEFRQRFADLAAAKGIDPTNLGEIAKQLNALTDEATDKLLNANPSAFYDKFAKSIGTTAEKLTDAQKRAAVFDEVLKKGAIFTGEADKKLNDAASATDRLNKKFEDAKESIGGAILPLISFVEALGSATAGAAKFIFQRDTAASKNGLINETNKFLNDTSALGLALKPITVPIGFIINTADKITATIADFIFGNKLAEEEKKTAEYSKQVAKVAEQVAFLKSTDQQIRDAQKNPFANADAFALSRVNLATGFNSQADREKAITQARADATAEIAAKKEQYEKGLKTAAGDLNFLKLINRQFQAETNLFDNDTRAKFTSEFASMISDAASKGFQKILSDPKTDLKTLRKTLSSVQASGDLQTDARGALAKDFQAAITKNVTDALTKVKEVEKAAQGVFDGLFAASGSNNPFVRVFSEADKAIENTRLNTAALNSSLRAVAETLTANINAGALFNARADAQLSAIDLRDQAASFRAGASGGTSARPAAAIDDVVRRVLNSDDLAGKLRAGNNDFAKLTDVQKRDLYQKQLFDTVGSLNVAGSSANALNQSSLIASLAAAGGANRPGADANLSIQERLQKQIDALNSIKTKSDEQAFDRRIIALTGSLRPEQLTAAQNNLAATVREREAARVLNAERDAQRVRAETLQVNKDISANISELVKVAKSDGVSGVIRIINEADDKARVSLGKRPTDRATADLMQK